MSNTARFFQPIKPKALLLAVLYLLGAGAIVVMYLYDFADHSAFNIGLFLLVIGINRLAYSFQRHKGKVRNFLYFTEACFILFLILILLLGEQYFTQYKLLWVPAIILSIIQVFGLKRMHSAS